MLFILMIIVGCVEAQGYGDGTLTIDCANCAATCPSYQSQHGLDFAVENSDMCSPKCLCSGKNLAQVWIHTVCPIPDEQNSTHCPSSVQYPGNWDLCMQCFETCKRDLRVCNDSNPNVCNCSDSYLVSCVLIRICPATEDQHVEYTLEYKVNVEFDDDLSNPNSSLYKEWSTNVTDALREFCNCQPTTVRFYSGSITVVVILEYNEDYSSQDIIEIINEAERSEMLLPGHNTSSIVLFLPNGGRRTYDYYNVGNMCASINDEINLAPTRGNSGGTIEVPIQMTDLTSSDSTVCSCIFEVASEGIPISRLRTDYSIDSSLPDVMQRDFLQFQACGKCDDCNKYFPTTAEPLWLQNDVSHFSVKLTSREFDVNSTLLINVLFEETTLWMSCGQDDLTSNTPILEDCESIEDDSKTNLALVIIPVTIVVVVGMLVVLVVVFLVRSQKTKQADNAENNGASNAAYVKSEGDGNVYMESEEQEEEYDYIKDNDLSSDTTRNNANLKRETRLSALNIYTYVDESDNKTQNPPNSKIPDYAVPVKKRERRNVKESVVLPDDYSLAGPSMPATNKNEPNNVRNDTDHTKMDSDTPIANSGIINMDGTTRSEERTGGSSNNLRDDITKESDKIDASSDVIQMEENCLYSGQSENEKVKSSFLVNGIYSGRNGNAGNDADNAVEESIFEENDVYNKI